MSPIPAGLSHRFRRLFLAAVLFTVSVGIVGAADTPDAIITGRVTNQATGDLLPNAVITVEGTRLATTADLEGLYLLRVPAGSHTLVISYPGLDEQRLAVVAAAGQTVTKSVALTAQVYQLEGVVVRSLREGQAAAIQDQKNAPNLKNSAAIDAFGNPGAAVGELMMRLPGVAIDGSGGEVGAVYIRGMTQDFSSLLLDGNQIATSGGTSVSNLNVYFGQVSTGNVSSMELIKSATPDMDGNAIAGYMNIRTKRAFERAPGRLITLTAGTAWGETYQDAASPIKDRPELDLADLQYSDVLSVLGGKNNLGLSASATWNIGNSNINEVGPRQAAAASTAYFVPAPAAGQPYEPLLRAYGAGQWGQAHRQSPTLNLGFNVDYKLGENTVLYARSTYNRVKTRSGSYPSYFRWILSAGSTSNRTAAMFDPDSTYDHLGVKNGTLDLQSVLYIRESESYSLASGVEQKLFGGTGKLNVDWNYSKNRTQYPRLNELGARLTGVSWMLDRRGRDPWYPLITQTGGADWSNPAGYGVRPDSRLISYAAPAQRWGAKADLQKDFATRFPTGVKVGVKQSNFRQSQNRDLNYYTYAGAPGASPYVGYNFKMSKSSYGPFPFLELPGSGLANDVWKNSANWTQTSSDAWNTVYQSLLNDAEFRDRVDAAYLLGDVRFDHLRVLGGVRYEKTTTTGSNYLRVSDSTNNNQSSATPAVNAARARANFRDWVTQGTKYDNLFPGLHAVYTAPRAIQLRADYSMTITRPSPTNLLPAVVPNYTNQTVSAGSPDLRPYTSNNFDLTASKYFAGIGEISANVFLKEIKNYFRSMPSVIGEGPDNGFGGDFAGWTLNRNRNVGRARIRGIELSYSQEFTFLPGLWRGLGVFGNYTYLETWGDFGSANGFTTQLPNLTPHSANGGISFRAHGITVRLLGNFRSTTYKGTTVGNNGNGAGVLAGSTNYDLYQHDRFLLDLKTQYAINRTYLVYFDIYNLTNDWTNSEYAHVFGRQIPSYASGVGTSFKAGVTARF